VGSHRLIGGGTAVEYEEANGETITLTEPPSSPFYASRATPAEREAYGIPDAPPTDSPAYAKWKTMIDQPIYFGPAPTHLLAMPRRTQVPVASSSLVSPLTSLPGATDAVQNSETTSRIWGGYLNFSRGGEIYNEAQAWFIEPKEWEPDSRCPTGRAGMSMWAGLGGDGEGKEGTLAQDGTEIEDRDEEEHGSDHQAWFEIDPQEAPVSAPNVHATPGAWFQADVKFKGSKGNNYTFWLYDQGLKKGEAKGEHFERTSHMKKGRKSAEFIVERPSDRPLLKTPPIRFQGFTNGTSFTKWPFERVNMEYKHVPGKYIWDSRPTNVYPNKYEYSELYEDCEFEPQNEEPGEITFGREVAPQVETGEAVGATESAAQLRGEVDPEGAQTTYHFEYGTEAGNYEESTAWRSAGEGEVYTLAADEAVNLRPGTLYHYRLIATNANGTAAGNEETFTTHGSPPPPPPTVLTGHFSSLKAHGVTLEGTVDPNGADTHYYVEYGLMPGFFSATAPASPGTDAGAGTTGLPVSVAVSHLAADTAYSYRFVAASSSGTVYGTEEKFTTPPAWKVLATPNPHGSVAFDQLKGVSCWSKTGCIAVGEYEDSSHQLSGLAMQWNGAEWTTLVTPTLPHEGDLGSALEAVSCTSAAFCIAAGYDENTENQRFALAERWNGTEWIPERPATRGETATLDSVSCVSTRECIAVGYDKTGSPARTAPVIDHWNGRRWKASKAARLPEAAESSWLDSVACSGSRSCIATGTYISKAYSNRVLTELWNGKVTLTSVSTPEPYTAVERELLGVSCAGASLCVAVGHYQNLEASVKEPLVDFWSGATWSAGEATEPLERPNEDEPPLSWGLEHISCASTAECATVGTYRYAGANVLVGELWNGAVWELESPVAREGVESNTLNAISCYSPEACVAVGWSTTGRFTAATLAESVELE
jgi:Peptidase A4 family